MVGAYTLCLKPPKLSKALAGSMGLHARQLSVTEESPVLLLEFITLCSEDGMRRLT